MGMWDGLAPPEPNTAKSEAETRRIHRTYVEEPGDSCSITHSNIPDVERERFGRIGEGYGSLAFGAAGSASCAPVQVPT